MSLRLTVLGSAGTHPGPAQACSSYLVESPGARVLLDCGNGSLSNLQRRCDVADLDAVVLSHLHPDHFADVYGLHYALRFHPTGERSVPIHAPAGALRHIAQLLGPGSEESFAAVCRFSEAAAGDVISVGDMTIALHAADHPVETLASRITAGGRTLAYTADSAYREDLVACAREVDLVIADATWQERQRPLPEGIHMTGAEAGRVAAEAGASALLLTHIIPTNDPDVTAAEAGAVYDGRVCIARDMMEIDL